MNGQLLVDIGNTAVKWAIRSAPGSALSGVGYHIHTASWSTKVLEVLWGALPRPAGVWFASVAESWLGDELAEWSRQRWQLEPKPIMSEPSAYGVVNGYRNHRQLGVDRWLALVAARARHRGACCIADLGTAATVDLMNEAGAHLGGLILPGIGTSRRALLEYTRIPRVADVATPVTRFGRDTATAVALGGRYALAAVIKSAVDFLAAQGDKPDVFLLGSEAQIIKQYLDLATIDAPHLVLEGIGRYAEDG